MAEETASAVYAWTLSALRVKPKPLVAVMRRWPTLEALLAALGSGEPAAATKGLLVPEVREQLVAACVEAEQRYEEHLAAGIMPVGLTDPAYSPLLARIADPPPVLLARGSLALLAAELPLAIVGTRHPTRQSQEAAQRAAAAFAARGACIVSGLAVGIDTAAHLGALDAEGPTIAVLANPLDAVHPATNRSLAQRIVDSDGLLLSELSLGEEAFRGAFVRRDRIQSGLSAAVVPVQTTADGGTMHTVRFAIAQSRRVLWPRWPVHLLETHDFSGNREALEHGEATFNSDDYDDIERELRAWCTIWNRWPGPQESAAPEQQGTLDFGQDSSGS